LSVGSMDLYADEVGMVLQGGRGPPALPQRAISGRLGLG
jgi:hypothetical protein